MRKVIKNFIWFGLFSILSIYSLHSFAAPQIGYVVASKGQVSIQRDNKSVVKARRRTKLYPGDEIITKKNSHVQLVFTDSGIIRVGANSIYKISKYSFKKNKKTFSTELKQGSVEGTTGQIVNNENKNLKHKKNYMIKTRLSQLAIYGSSFSTSLDKKEQDVNVWTGSGRITVGGRSVLLGPDYIHNHVLVSSNFIEPDFLTSRALMFLQAASFAPGAPAGPHGAGGVLPE